MATTLSSTSASMMSVMETPVNGHAVASSSSSNSASGTIVKKEEGAMLSVENGVVDDRMSSSNVPLPVKTEEGVSKKEEDVPMPMSAIEDSKPTPPPPSGSGSTTPALPPPTAPKRTGPQLIPELPIATDAALATFTQLQDNHYQYQTLGRSREAEEGMMCDCHYVHGEDNPSSACGDGSDCINRLTQIECVEGECRCRKWCQNQRFAKKQYANIEIVQTEKKGFGLRAAETIPKDGFIYEYIGDVISHPSFMKRMRDYASEGIKHFYFMMLQKEEYIDATKRGGIARFANHSCAPNCYVAKWTVGPRVRMGIFASRTIRQYEELTFNYNVDRYGHDAQPCYCGEPNCVGFLGGKTQTDIGGMDTLFLDALGITDEVEALGLKGSKKKKGKKLDEDYTPILKPLVELEAPKLIRALNQTTSRKVLLKLLTRIRMTEDLGPLRQLMRLRGYSLMNRVLGDYMKDPEIVLLVLEGIKRWPLLQRNKIEDSKVDVPVSELASSSEDDRVKTLAQELLDHWSTLETAYRIPKREWNAAGGSGSGNGDTFLADREREREERAREDAAKRARYTEPDMPKWTFVPAVVKPASPIEKEKEKVPEKPAVKVIYRDEEAIRRAAYQEVQAMIQRAKDQAKAEQEAAEAKAKADALKAEKEAARRERKLKGPVSVEEKEALKEKQLQKLISPVVVKALSKHRDVLNNDAFKKHAKELTQIIADKEKKSSSYKAGQLDSLSEEKNVKMKKFAKEYIAKILRKLSKAADGTNGTNSNGTSSSSSSKHRSSRHKSGNGHTSTRTSSSLSLPQLGADGSAMSTPNETSTPNGLEDDSMGVDVDLDGDVDMDDPDSPPSPGDHDQDKGDADVSTSNSPSVPSTPIGGTPDKQPTSLDPRLLKTKPKQDREPAKTSLSTWFPDQEGKEPSERTL